MVVVHGLCGFVEVGGLFWDEWGAFHGVVGEDAEQLEC